MHGAFPDRLLLIGDSIGCQYRLPISGTIVVVAVVYDVLLLGVVVLPSFLLVWFHTIKICDVMCGWHGITGIDFVFVMPPLSSLSDHYLVLLILPASSKAVLLKVHIYFCGRSERGGATMMFDEFFRSVVGGGKEKSCEAVDGLKSSPQGTGGSGADYGMRVETSALVTTYVPRTGQTHASARCENVATVPQIPATPAPGTSILAACSSFVCYLVKNSIRIINVTGERALLHLPPEGKR